MNDFQAERRILIIDDQSAIHETFVRIFRGDQPSQSDLDEFEARFLHDETADQAQGVKPSPIFALHHAYSGEEGVHVVG